MTSLPGVTVVVPTLNRGTYLLDTIADLLGQEYWPLEILLVDQSDTIEPELEALVAEHPDVIAHHRVAFTGLPIARNYGWQMAKHDLIVYVDDDIRCGKQLVGEHVRSLLQPGVGLSGGGIDDTAIPDEFPAHTGTYDRWRAVARRGFNATGDFAAAHVPGGNFGAWRSVLAEAGGLDERLDVGSALFEETDLALRVQALGYRAWFNGAARLTHLAAGVGGTRQRDMRTYVLGLSHNRSVVIRRHSRWYQWPVGLFYSARLILAYAYRYRDPRILPRGLHGLARGWWTGKLPPRCTTFDPKHCQ